MLHQRRRYQRQLVAPQRQQEMPIGFLVANLRVPKAFPNHAIKCGGTPSVHMSAYDIGYLYCTREIRAGLGLNAQQTLLSLKGWCLSGPLPGQPRAANPATRLENGSRARPGSLVTPLDGLRSVQPPRRPTPPHGKTDSSECVCVNRNRFERDFVQVRQSQRAYLCKRRPWRGSSVAFVVRTLT